MYLRYSRVHWLERTAWNIVDLLRRECIITWAMCQNNFPGIAGCFFGGLMPRIVVIGQPMDVTAGVLLRTAGIALMWEYVLDVCNTSTAVDEDRLNKPHRPIPAGLITLQQSRMRWAISWTLMPLAALVFYGKEVCYFFICWELWLIVFYVWPANDHWFMKAVMAAGPCLMMLRLLNHLVQDIPSWQVCIWPDLFSALWTLLTVHLQDFRDIEGDRSSHAKTLPLILSASAQARLRWGTAFILILSCFLSMFWVWTRAACISTLLTGALFYWSSSVLAYYTFEAKSPEECRRLYSWWMIAGFFGINHVFNLFLVVDI